MMTRTRIGGIYLDMRKRRNTSPEPRIKHNMRKRRQFQFNKKKTTCGRKAAAQPRERRTGVHVWCGHHKKKLARHKSSMWEHWCSAKDLKKTQGTMRKRGIFLWRRSIFPKRQEEFNLQKKRSGKKWERRIFQVEKNCEDLPGRESMDGKPW